MSEASPASPPRGLGLQLGIGAIGAGCLAVISVSEILWQLGVVTIPEAATPVGLAILASGYFGIGLAFLAVRELTKHLIATSTAALHFALGVLVLVSMLGAIGIVESRLDTAAMMTLMLLRPIAWGLSGMTLLSTRRIWGPLAMPVGFAFLASFTITAACIVGVFSSSLPTSILSPAMLIAALAYVAWSLLRMRRPQVA